MSAKNLYDELGVPPESTHEEIKAAYRRKIAKAHPDRAGGDKIKALAINEAWRVLGDERLRARYDATDSVESEDFRRTRLIGEMINAFMQIAEQSDVLHDDLIEKLRRSIRDTKQREHVTLQQLQGRVRRYEAVASRIRLKKKKKSDAKEALFAQAAQRMVEECRKNIRIVEAKMEEKDLMLEMIEDFAYAFEPRNGLTTGATMGFTWGSST